MANAWDDVNLGHNLDALGRLRTATGKPKLRYRDGRFDIDDRWFKGIRRGDHDSVTSDENFATPLQHVLARAQELVGQGTLEPDRFDKAIDGLIRLRRTYDGNADKVANIDAILRNFVPEGFTRGLTGNSEKLKKIVDLRTKYGDYMLYSFRQRDYLTEEQPDVCEGLVILWARRILLGRTSYLRRTRKETGEQIRTKSARMQKKVAHASRLQQAIGAQLRDDRDLSEFQDDPKFGGLRYDDEASRTNMDEATDRIDAACWRAILRAARAGPRSSQENEKVSMVKLLKKGDPLAHALGLRVYGDDYRDTQLFDPNVGEFRFMRGAEQNLYDFTGDLTSDLYTAAGRWPWSKTQLFDSWGVKRICQVDPEE
jgi:hypothetical protein